MQDALRFYLYLRITHQHKSELDTKTDSVLAVQVVDHLLGDDFNEIYNALPSDIQNTVDTISHMIEPKAHEIMTQDSSIRELIIRYIMTTWLIYHCLFDKSWFDKPVMRNRKLLIDKYPDNQYTEVTDFVRCITFISDFIQTTKEEPD